MKKSRLIGLSLLAFSAVGVLASCGGQKAPVSKPDVYFRATASILDTSEEFKKTEFKNTECAEVTIVDKDKLEYEKQDVVINITPKRFFSFRKYNADWEATSAPSRPYVGLGSPVALYNYPLQENVAWTFKDKSTPVEGLPGFYHEEYEITVKKEFFKKNIVIDYGNVTGYDGMYVYDSTRYQAAFNNALVGDFASIYTMDNDKSLFVAASDGATITYKFTNSSNPYSLNDWDKPKTPNGLNDESSYEHFEVVGIKSDGKREIISKYDSSKEKQLFTPTVVNNKYLSFFIDWDVLSTGVDDGYEPKFEQIEVNLGKPDIASNCEITFSHDEGITEYPVDYFQYPEPGKTILHSNMGAKLNTYDPNETTKQLEFENVFSQQKSEVRYGKLFLLPKDQKCFSVEINEIEQFDVDLVSDPSKIARTNWRSKVEGTTTYAETPFWSWNAWYLVLLNPDKELATNPSSQQAATGPRTFGLPTGFAGNNNLYYLYTDSMSNITGHSHSINIKLKEAPVMTTFTLDNASQQYGALTKTGEYITKYNCIGKKEFTINFYTKKEEIYIKKQFNVTIQNEASTSWKANYNYIVGYMAEIRIFSANGTDVVSENDAFTITLSPLDSVTP